jgi:hypothetical protein
MSMLDDRPDLDVRDLGVRDLDLPDLDVRDLGVDDLDDLEPISDDELTALALAADPDQPVGPDAVPLAPTCDRPGLLPAWYMPVTARVTHKRWHKVLVIAAIVGFVAINAFGFCITYGLLEQA